MSDVPPAHVIVVDDDLLTRKLVQRELQAVGYEVEGHGDGRAALEPICQMGHGIVVADWSMPVMDGLELCRAVQELKEMQAIGNIYFILLTAHSAKEKVVRGLQAGANDYLTKPYDHGELLARVQVGQRMLALQEELLSRNVEVQKANAQMAVLANKLEQLANTDGLTGLTNRRRLFERFEEIWSSTGADKHAVSCLMLDVDHFKRINDTYGHSAGDQVLKKVAERIRRNAPRAELCGRFGGEEFLLVLPAMPADSATALAEKIRQSIAAHTVEFEGNQIAVTVSCGVAEKSPSTTCPDDLVCRADAALYAAKGHGRNRTWRHGDEDGSLHPAGEAADESPESATISPDKPSRSPVRRRHCANPL